MIGGGDDYGAADDYDVRRTLDALDKTIQGLPKSIEASLQVKGVFHSKGVHGSEQLKSLRDDFESHIISSGSGVIATDLVTDFTPVKIDAPAIPDTAMKFMKSVLQEKYGISAAILSGDYTGEQHSAFYQTAIEDFINQFEQAFTAYLYTPRELDLGHKLKGYYSKINYMNNTAKAELSTLATNTGLMTLNQIADMYGLEPFMDGNRRLQSLNYVSTAIIDSYQMAQSGAGSNENGGNESGE
jgi:hypothetical protein